MLKVHPKNPVFAVAERGEEPLIILYTWPSKRILSVLKNGTTNAYSCITFRFRWKNKLQLLCVTIQSKLNYERG